MSSLNVIELDRITQILQRRCEDLNVTLTWSQYASTASTNGHNITLPSVKLPVTRQAMDKLYGFVIHEAGHHSRPDAFDILNSAQPNEAMCALMNIVEDDGMEREVGTAYLGDGIALGKGNNAILHEIADNWANKAITDKWPAVLTTEQAAPMAVCAIGQLSRLEWDGMSTSARAKFFNTMHPSTKKLRDELVVEGWVNKFQATTNPHECWDVAVDLYKRLYPDADDDETEDKRAKGHAKAGPPAPSGNSEGGDGTNGDVPKSEEEGDTDAKNKPGQGMVVSWKDAVISEHNEWQAKPDGAVPGNIGIDWADYQKGSVGLMPQNLVNVMNCRTKQFKPESVNDYGNCGTPESFMPDNSQARAFGNQVRRYLQSLTRTRVVSEKYHGRINKAALTKLIMPPIDGGEWNKKLFYSMEEQRGKDTCIQVLTDWSGSMQGDKMIYAADASGRLVQVFDRVLRMPVQLAAFTNGRTRCDIGLIKGFNDRSMSPLDIATAFSRFYKFSSANNDADSVMWGYNQLLRRKEQRKILIVLSDGAPAGQWAGSGKSNLTHVCKSIQKEGKVELYGVGICSDAVLQYYENSQVLNSADEINNTLFNIIKKGAKG